MATPIGSKLRFIEPDRIEPFAVIAESFTDLAEILWISALQLAVRSGPGQPVRVGCVDLLNATFTPVPHRLTHNFNFILRPSDGSLLAWDQYGRLLMWDAPDFLTARELIGQPITDAGFMSAAVSSNGQRFGFVGNRGTPSQVHEIGAGNTVIVGSLNQDEVYTSCFNFRGDKLFCGTNQGLLYFPLPGTAPTGLSEGHGSIQYLCRFGLGQLLAISENSGELLLVDAIEGRIIERRQDLRHAARGLAADPFGRFVAICSEASIIDVWDIKDRRIAAVLKTASGGSRSCAFSPDGQMLAAPAPGGGIGLYALFGDPPPQLVELFQQNSRSSQEQATIPPHVHEPEPIDMPKSAVAEPVVSVPGAASDTGTVDTLNYGHYGMALANLVESPETNLPLVIGLLGPWGIGKSFLMDFLLDELRRRAQERTVAAPMVYSVAFDAWYYNTCSAIWPGLVRGVFESVEREAPASWLERFSRGFLRRIRAELIAQIPVVILWLMLLVAVGATVLYVTDLELRGVAQVLSVIGVAGFFEMFRRISEHPFSKKIAELLKREESYGHMDAVMTQVLDDLAFLEERLRKREARILITVDNLDRCDPTKVVEVLQTVNLLLSRRSFIVIIGLDQRITTCAIESYHQGLLKHAAVSGSEYLEKIVQVPFYVPTPSLAEIRHFLRKLLLARSPALNDAEQRLKTKLLGSAASARLATADNEMKAEARERYGLISVSDAEAHLEHLNVSENHRSEAERIETVLNNHDQRTLGTLTFEASTEPAETRIHRDPFAKLRPFSRAEGDALDALAPYMRPVPRHLKRITNIYRLVRDIAEQRHDTAVADDPAAAIRMLLLTGQWPDVAYLMFRSFGADLVSRRVTEGKSAEWPEGDALGYYFRKLRAEGALPMETGDLEVLEGLIASPLGFMSFENFEKVHRYAINFQAPWIFAAGVNN